ncbi:three component ABC system middle component [Paenibacillus thermotolerans]|uniref:three component ABC system middle component n=1 Tax=Paenibacillus thermotolerans TaxID=3027807 RepID=UPI002368B79C|nr:MULTISPECIES: three component ABC system middle component [unclassified Paenibacillus]
MNSWNQRPTEVANLLNPAFCGYILKEYVKSYESETGTGVPFELMFLLLPIVLHRHTREQLPSTIRTHLQYWLQSNPEIRIGFANRVNEMIGITRESMLFLIHKGYLTELNGRFFATEKRYRRFLIDDEIKEIANKSKFVGRWFSNSSSSTIYTMWGICP